MVFCLEFLTFYSPYVTRKFASPCEFNPGSTFASKFSIPCSRQQKSGLIPREMDSWQISYATFGSTKSPILNAIKLDVRQDKLNTTIIFAHLTSKNEPLLGSIIRKTVASKLSIIIILFKVIYLEILLGAKNFSSGKAPLKLLHFATGLDWESNECAR